MEDNQNKSWWQRNWKWAAPTGGCLIIVIVMLSFLGYGVYKAVDTISGNTSVFEFVKVITEVQKNEEVAEALGKPIRIEDDDYDPSLENDRMELEMLLEGTKDDGILKVIADKTDDGWEYSKFEVIVEDTGEIIDLRTALTD